MLDDTPPPFEELTNHWIGLSDDDRVRHGARLVGDGCPDHHLAHVDTPGLDEGACYERLVRRAVAGDPVALGWLAETHRPMLIARGRAILERDPSEWGSICEEVLLATIARADYASGQWLRRRISDHMALQVSRIVRRYLKRRAAERPTAPDVLQRTPLVHDATVDPHPDLTIAVYRSLQALDGVTRDALQALVNHEPLAEVADRHHLSHAAVRQRACRARRRLQPELAGFVRGAL